MRDLHRAEFQQEQRGLGHLQFFHTGLTSAKVSLKGPASLISLIAMFLQQHVVNVYIFS